MVPDRNAFSKIRNDVGTPILTTLPQHGIRSPGHCVKKTKGKQTGKKEVNLPIFANDIIVYIENFKESTKISKTSDSKITGYKTNIQELITCL